jgi:hypothetical protein
MKPMPQLKPVCVAGRLDDGSKRYRVVDPVEGGSASKHGVFKVRTEAESVCSKLKAA